MSICVVLVALLAACEEDVTAVTGTELPYSLYGVLSPQLDTQWVRVFPIEDRLVPAEAGPLDARVTSTDLTTGEERVWNDSVIVDFADQFAHVYWSPFKAAHDHAYQLNVERSDGARSSVDVTVPALASIELRDPLFRAGGVVQPVFVNAPVPNLLEVHVRYDIAFKLNNRDDITSDTIDVRYVLEHEQVDGGWIIPVALRDDFDKVRARLVDDHLSGFDRRVGVILLDITIRFIVGSEDWSPPNGLFNPEFIIQPGVLRNVQNGFGIVSAGYRLERQWLPSRIAIEASGFRPPEES